MDNSYKHSVSLALPFEDAVVETKEKLADEGFGVLMEIDVRETLKQKLDVSFPKYLILGICNPSLAHRALQKEIEVGLLLPCNVVVREDGGKVYVSVLRPSRALSITDNDALNDIAQEAEQKLIHALNTLQ